MRWLSTRALRFVNVAKAIVRRLGHRMNEVVVWYVSRSGGAKAACVGRIIGLAVKYTCGGRKGLQDPLANATTHSLSRRIAIDERTVVIRACRGRCHARDLRTLHFGKTFRKCHMAVKNRPFPRSGESHAARRVGSSVRGSRRNAQAVSFWAGRGLRWWPGAAGVGGWYSGRSSWSRSRTAWGALWTAGRSRAMEAATSSTVNGRW